MSNDVVIRYGWWQLPVHQRLRRSLSRSRMTIPPRTVTSDAARLEALRALQILDTPTEPKFDRLIEMAKAICETPIALISLVDGERQWFKARSGFEPCETDLERSVCAHALAKGSTLVLPDLTLDPRTADNPLVTGDEAIRFYAGALLTTEAGQHIGTLCVIDTVARPTGLTPHQLQMLEGLAQQAASLMEMRAASARREEVNTADRDVSDRSQEALQAGRVGTFDVDLATNQVSISPEACRVFGLVVHPTYEASVLEGLVLDQDRGRASSSSDRRSGTSKGVTEYRIRRAHDREVRWVARRGDFITGDEGEPIRFAGTVSDITDRKMVELRQQVLIEVGEIVREADSVNDIIREAARLLGENLGASRVGYAAIDIPSDLFDVRADWCAPDVETLVGPHSLAAFHGTAKFLRTGQTLVVSNISGATWLRGDSDGYAVIGTNAKIKVPMMRRAQLIGCLFVHHAKARSWSAKEVTFVETVAERVYAGVARIEAEEEQTLLNQELSHRLKNTLAMVSAIAKQTLKGVEDRAAVDAFQARILALSSAHDVLLQTSWTSARISSLIQGVMSRHAKPDRVVTTGPDIRLGPKGALSFSMLLHELATNAVKYGALSTDTGTVAMDWKVSHTDGDAELDLVWRETGGPEASAPARSGFGSRLIQTGLVGAGKAELNYAPSGLVAEFRAPMKLVTQF